MSRCRRTAAESFEGRAGLSNVDGLSQDVARLSLIDQHGCSILQRLCVPGRFAEHRIVVLQRGAGRLYGAPRIRTEPGVAQACVDGVEQMPPLAVAVLAGAVLDFAPGFEEQVDAPGISMRRQRRTQVLFLIDVMPEGEPV